MGFVYNSTRYYYGKNLFGDIVDIYDSYGTKLAHYAYDAWGNHTVTHYNGSTVGNINPFRYRGYYFDTETGFYYLQSRYYDPTTGRFLNADAISYLGSTGEFSSYNLYIYCGNNPVTYTAPAGHEFQHLNLSTWKRDSGWREFLPVITDVLVGAAAILGGIFVGLSVAAATGSFDAGLLALAATVGLINNAVNFVYYTWISDGKTDITASSYTSGYVPRWDRLDYTKKMVGDDWYSPNAWMYYSEYNAHMLGWYVLEVVEALGISWFSGYRKNLEKADVIVGKFDDNQLITKIATFICMILGW